MERIIRKMFLVGCLLTGLGVSLTAATSYADTVTGPNAATTGASMNTTFSLAVGPAYTLTKVEFVGNAKDESGNILTDDNGNSYIQAIPGGIAKGTLSATVQSNTGYQLQLSAEEPALKSSTDETIPANTFADSDTLITSSAWGIKKPGANEFTALTSTGSSFFASATSAPTGISTDFEVGVGIAKTQPAGNYATTVTVTVVKN